VVRKFDLATKLPSSVLDSVEAAGHHALTKTAGEHFTLLNNESALQAAAKAAESRDLVTNIASDIGDEPIESGCKLLVERVRQLRRPNQLTTLISGGEFACPVRGNGIGGRNLETALRLALSPEFNSSEAIVALCAGTDGIDGNSPAAGALVDNSTLSRSRAIGLDAEDFLRRSDAYSFFVALGDVIATGPTGTNVRDLRIMIS
jgi:hydroxypyruvate reductase